MHSIVMVVALLLGQQPDIDRSSLDMIGESEPLQASPAEQINRLEDGSELRKKTAAKIKSVVKLYKNNELDIQVKLVTRKMMDWIYSLAEVQGALNIIEQLELNTMIHEEIAKSMKPEPEPEKVPPKTATPPITITIPKEWFWANYSGYNVLLYGWTDPNTGQKLFNLNEQQPNVQALILQQGR